ncbi:MAG: hypothetical protein ACE5GT_08530 [Rhodospirillales bacterium]
MDIRFYIRQILAGTAIYAVLAMIASMAQVPMVGHGPDAWRQADPAAFAATSRNVGLREENIVP